MDGFDAGGEAGGEGEDLVAGFEDAAGDAAGIAAEVVVGGEVGADDVLDGEAGVDVVGVGADVNGFEVVEEGGSLVPGHVGGFVDDVVAFEGGDGDEGDVDEVVEAGGEGFEGGGDLVEGFLGVADEVHFVDGEDDVLDAEEVGDEGVAAGLFDDAFAGVDEDDGEVGGGGAGDHVAGVLDVAGGVGDDEFAAGGGEVAVGDVDGDALFAFGAEAVGEEGEVDVVGAALGGGALEGFELVFEDVFGVVEEAADEGALAVVHAAGGGEAEEVHVEIAGGHDSKIEEVL